jgi:hypothetical protein
MAVFLSAFSRLEAGNSMVTESDRDAGCPKIDGIALSRTDTSNKTLIMEKSLNCII